MTLGLAFWILMLLWLVGALWWSGRWNQGSAVWAPDLLLFILLLLLGWHAFGPPIHG
jgi:hypothetical protein